MTVSDDRGGLPWLAVLLLVTCVLAAACAGETTTESDEAGDEQAEGGEDQGDEPEEAAAEAEGGGDDAEEKKPKKRKERAISVTAAPVVRGDLVLPVMAEGSIRARNATEIKFEVAGRIEDLWVREGQRVRRGQRLVALDNREYALQLEEARSRYLQALGQLAVEEEGYNTEAAQQTLEAQTAELEKMEADGLITRRERLDQELELGMSAVREGAYRRELLEVRSGLAAARADATRAEILLEKTELHAPFSGVVTNLESTRGERVQLGQTLFRLVDDINIEAEIGVLESDLGALEAGRAALLTLPALGETLPVTVDVISPDIDAQSRTCPVLLRLKNSDGHIKPGMFARAAIAGQVLEDRLLVPREAVVTRDGRPVIFKVEEKRSRWVYVQLGARNDHLIEITRVDQGGPLDPGTLVVVDNHLTLTHDALIKVRKRADIADPWFATGAEDEASD